MWKSKITLILANSQGLIVNLCLQHFIQIVLTLARAAQSCPWLLVINGPAPPSSSVRGNSSVRILQQKPSLLQGSSANPRDWIRSPALQADLLCEPLWAPFPISIQIKIQEKSSKIVETSFYGVVFSSLTLYTNSAYPVPSNQTHLLSTEDSGGSSALLLELHLNTINKAGECSVSFLVSDLLGPVILFLKTVILHFYLVFLSCKTRSLQILLCYLHYGKSFIVDFQTHTLGHSVIIMVAVCNLMNTM